MRQRRVVVPLIQLPKSFLSSLSHDDAALVAPHLHPVELRRDIVLYEGRRRYRESLSAAHRHYFTRRRNKNSALRRSRDAWSQRRCWRRWCLKWLDGAEPRHRAGRKLWNDDPEFGIEAPRS